MHSAVGWSLELLIIIIVLCFDVCCKIKVCVIEYDEDVGLKGRGRGRGRGRGEVGGGVPYIAMYDFYLCGVVPNYLLCLSLCCYKKAWS